MSQEFEVLVEKVARGICAAIHGTEEHWDGFLLDARAALRVVAEALREPTVKMQNRGNAAMGGWVAPAMHSAEAWRAMLAAHPISEALRHD